MDSLKHFRHKRPLAQLLKASWLIAWLISGEGVASSICTTLAERNNSCEVLVHLEKDGTPVYVFSQGDSTDDTCDLPQQSESKWHKPCSEPEQHHQLSFDFLNVHQQRESRFPMQAAPAALLGFEIGNCPFFDRAAEKQNGFRRTQSSFFSSGLKVRQSCKVMRC